jgi:hypothetical protein
MMLDQHLINLETAKHAIWLTAYLRGLRSMDPELAETCARDAVQKYMSMRKTLLHHPNLTAVEICELIGELDDELGKTDHPSIPDIVQGRGGRNSDS